MGDHGRHGRYKRDSHGRVMSVVAGHLSYPLFISSHISYNLFMSRLSFEFVVEGILLFVVGSIGLIANIAAVCIFLTKKKHTFYGLMISLCVYDCIYLTASITMFSIPLLHPNIVLNKTFTHSVPFLLPIAQTSMTGYGERPSDFSK